MAEILLVNPKRRRRRKTSARRRRRSTTRAAAPRRRRRARRTVSRRRRNIYLNPRRRRRSRRVLSRRVRRRNPSLRGSIGGMTSALVPTLKAGFVGATGAIGLDLLWGYTSRFMPAQIAASPLAQYAAKLVGAILVGIIGNKIKPGKGRDLSVGAATVVLHDAIKAQLKSSFPALQLGEYLTFAPTVGGSMRRAGRVLDSGMGEYLSGLPNEEVDGSYSGAYTEDY